MAQRTHVPEFGNWEGEENVPYTAYFEKARKGRNGGKMVNPNDPEENPDIPSDNSSSAQAPPSKARAEPQEPIGDGVVRAAHGRQRSREDGDFRQFTDSSPHHDNVGRRASGESTPQRHGGRVGAGETQRKHVRQSAGSEHSIERSPLHHARISGRGNGTSSPSWEGRGSLESSHGTPGRSRMKPATREDESLDEGFTVPKFGEWDESNPASSDGYSHIFNKVREERQIGAGKVPGMSPRPSYVNARKQTNTESVKSCCFPWGRK